MTNETYYFYRYHSKQASVLVANHPGIQTKTVTEALNIYLFMLSRWKKQRREGVLREDTKKMTYKNLPNELEEARKTINMLQQQLKEAQ